MVFNWELILRLIVAALLGGIIGTERSLTGKSAGLRTYAIVALGSALFTLVSRFGFEGMAGFASPDRIASNIVVGVGFIGAGIIIFSEHKLHGLTTAAGIWLAAAIGMTSALGLYLLAFASTLIGLIIFWALRRLEEKIRQRGEKLEGGQTFDESRDP